MTPAFGLNGMSHTPSSDAHHAPALSSSSALARFEFAHGRVNEGTKVLMVEWDDKEEKESSRSTADWIISRDGKRTVVSANAGANDGIHRVYFLIAPGYHIPRCVKVAQDGGITLQTNPLPAIFPPEFGATATASGKLGVLHTVYAKQRLSVLQREIDQEMVSNGEGIGLHMALQEKQWIEDNFGIGPRVIHSHDSTTSASSASPRLAGGSRIADKLKGLKLGTTDSALETKDVHLHSRIDTNPLSPEARDVVVSSFSLFHGDFNRSQSRHVAQKPPDHVLSIQNQTGTGGTGMNSLVTPRRSDSSVQEAQEMEDELFAIKLSPRSPEMTKSPFGFTVKDIRPYLAPNV